MMTASAYRDESRLLRHPALPGPIRIRGRRDVGPQSRQAHQHLLLRTLIDIFGGEAASADLARHLSRNVIWPLAMSSRLVSEALQALQDSGALLLEASGPGAAIVTLLPHGADLAFDPARDRAIETCWL